MTKLKNKNHSMILTEKQQKSDHYYPGKLINMNFLQAKKYYLLIKEECKMKLRLHILFQEKLLKIKQKQLKNMKNNKLKLQKFQIQKNNQKQESIEGPFSKEMRNDEIKNEIDETEK